MSKWRIDVNGPAWPIGIDCLAGLIGGGIVMLNSKGGQGLAREERLQIMLSQEELEAVDTYRFLHRMPSRAAAVRELLRHGIANVGKVMENAGVRSGDYNVLKAAKGVGSERKSKS